MPRANIYLSADLALELASYPGEINLSEVCGAALRAELTARMQIRHIGQIFQTAVRSPGTDLGHIMSRYGLRYAMEAAGGIDAKEAVAIKTADALNRMLFEGVQLAVGGGTQMWSVMRRLEPRNLRIGNWAIGAGSLDRVAPHVHANFLVTLLNLLYAPRSTAMLVGSPAMREAWRLDVPESREIQRIIIGSCGLFDAESGYAQVLGRETASFLEESNVVGDYLGVFFGADGSIVEPWVPGSGVSHIGSGDLREHARRSDTIVALVAAGPHKVKLMRLVLAAGLCNTLITDEATATGVA